MKLFDLHCDIGTDVEESLLKGIQSPFTTRHLSKLQQGSIDYVCCACFFEGSEDWDYMVKMITDLEKELEESDVIFVKEQDDYYKEGKTHTIISVEGMCGVKEDPRAKIQFMAEHHVKVASLAWNDQNNLASGVKADVCRGLTEAGLEAIDEMAKCGIALDVSHLNEASFWDVIKYHKGKICATHSNAKHLCDVERNLTNQQIKAIAQRDGIIGMNACAPFVDHDKSKQDAYHLALHAKYIADLVGVRHIACGFDFMDFFGGDDMMAKGLHDSSCGQNFVDALYEVGFNEEEVAAICYQNALRFFSE